LSAFLPPAVVPAGEVRYPGPIRTLGDAFQEFEGNIYDIYTGEFFSQARGARLDAWGETYGVLRLGLEISGTGA
jgi:hypothetical protein